MRRAPNAARLQAEYCWIVDPLDGTQEFVAGIPEFVVSIALVRHGSLVSGAVQNPATGEGGTWAQGMDRVHFRGLPSRREGGTPALHDCTVVVSRGEIDRGTARPLQERFPLLRAVGSSAYKLLRVAAGADDLFVSLEPKSEWDVCGGITIMQAAGMKSVFFSGKPLVLNCADTRIRSGMVAGRPELVAAFMRDCADLVAAT